jgi:hypothetical protein
MSRILVRLAFACVLCSSALAAEQGKDQKPLTVLLVNGDLRKETTHNETGRLKSALTVTPPGTKQRYNVMEQETLDLGDKKLPLPDVIILCNLAELSEAQAVDLEAFVKQGGGLIVFLGNKVEPAKYNQCLYRNGKGLLPARLKEVVELRNADIDLRKATYPEVAKLPPIEKPVVHKIYSLDVLQDEQVRVVCPLSGGEPLLVEKQFGRGKCLLVATTCDRDWNELPVSPLFLPLFDVAVREVGRK